MACNCHTKEEINRLYKIYGDKLKSSEDRTLWETIQHWFYVSFTLFSWAVILPFLSIYILLFAFWKEPGERNINVQNFNLLKVFHLGKYARE